MSIMNNISAAINNAVQKEEVSMNMNTNLISTDGISIVKISTYLNILSVDDIKKIAKEIGIVEVARLRNKEKIISIISRIMESRKETMEFIEREAYRRALEVQGKTIASVKTGIAINPLDDPEVQAMDVSDDALLKPETAEEKLAAMNPGFISVTVNSTKEEKEMDNNITLMATKEMIVPVGDLNVTSDKMVVNVEQKGINVTVKKEENKMEEKKVVVNADDRSKEGDRLAIQLIIAWMYQTEHPYKENKSLFFKATGNTSYKGNYITFEKKGSHPLYAVTISLLERFYPEVVKNAKDKNAVVNSAYNVMIKRGLCHKYGATFIHMTEEEYQKCWSLYKNPKMQSMVNAYAAFITSNKR